MAAAGTALTAIVVGGGSGGALLCLALAAAHGMPRGPDTTFANIAIGAGVAGLTSAAGIGFALARPLGVWRAAVSAMVSLAGAALVGVLTTAADIAGGIVGLLVLAALCIGVSFGAWRLRPVKGEA
jgi:hypothetical protein